MKRFFLCAFGLCMPLFVALMSFIPPDSTGLVDGVLAQTNQFRKAQGLPGLMMKDELNKIAKKHSVDMASGRVPFGHQGFDDRNIPG